MFQSDLVCTLCIAQSKLIFLRCTLYGTDMHHWTSVTWWLANINAATLLILEQTCVRKVTNQKLKVPSGLCNVNGCKNTEDYTKSSVWMNGEINLILPPFFNLNQMYVFLRFSFWRRNILLMSFWQIFACLHVSSCHFCGLWQAHQGTGVANGATLTLWRKHKHRFTWLSELSQTQRKITRLVELLLFTNPAWPTQTHTHNQTR